MLIVCVCLCCVDGEKGEYISHMTSTGKATEIELNPVKVGMTEPGWALSK